MADISLTPRIIPFPSGAARKKTTDTPRTFRDALKQGFLVVRDQSKQSGKQTRREGTLTLQNPGRAELLEIEYVGTVNGYRFSVPKIVATN